MHTFCKNRNEQPKTTAVSSVMSGLFEFCEAMDSRNPPSEFIIKDRNIELFHYNAKIGVTRTAATQHEEIKGDVFTTTDQLIIHGTNCLGVMGAGFANVVKYRYPDVYDEYQLHCRKNMSFVILGTVQFVKSECMDKKIIGNVFTQESVAGRVAGRPFKYRAFMLAMADVVKYCKANGLTSFSMPRIGSDLGGGDWEVIKHILWFMFHNTGIKPNVYVLERPAFGMFKGDK
ncbi:hypothetical protein SHAb15599_00013 [Acinetobacter phage SH-Ab 15599]|nr:hypothetical protein SHAb15599_00013 [Acinetobacter phage SH-Ab 15599]